MARLSKTNAGAFSGAIGPVIGGSWRGIAYIRAKPGKRKKKATSKQKANEAKFALMGRTLKPMSELFRTSFNLRPDSTGYASAFSHNFKNAFTGVYPKLAIDFSSMLLSKGDLQVAEEVKVTVMNNGRIAFSWKNNSGFRSAKATDKAITVAYCAESGWVVYNTDSAERISGRFILDAGALQGMKVHCWLGFISANGKDVADSVYAGEWKLK
jgi:hypothetical protein